MVTASPARPTERSEDGTTAGVLVAVKQVLDNRPVTFASDVEGRITDNAQLRGWMLTLSWIEILLLAGCLESGLGFTASNCEFIIDLEYATRGGKIHFILGMDANALPDEWENVWWRVGSNVDGNSGNRQA